MSRVKTKPNENNLKKAAFIEAYVKAFGNVSRAAQAVGIRRETYYAWINEDAEFKAAISATEPEEVFIDFAENALARRIGKGDTTAIIFALKTKGKRRGYVERIEQTGKDGGPIETTVRVIEPGD